MKLRLLERIEIIMEDGDMVLISKAAGVLSYPLEERREEAAIQLVRRYWKAAGIPNQNLYLLHRLDQDTSGLMIFAKTSLARESLRRQFEEHSILRSYVAVTCGIPENAEGTIRTQLARDFRGRRSVSQTGREAVTHYMVLHRNPQRGRALVRCRLHTGRTHQVRIHMSHLNSPVLGDAVYGRKGEGRLMLHSEALGFIHPRTGVPIVFRISLPPEFRRSL